MKTLKQIYKEAFSPKQFDTAVRPIKKTLGGSVEGPAANYISGLENIIKTMGKNPESVNPKTIRQLMQNAHTAGTQSMPPSIDPQQPGIPDIDLFKGSKKGNDIKTNPKDLHTLGGISQAPEKEPPLPLPQIEPSQLPQSQPEPFQGTFPSGPPEDSEEPIVPSAPKPPFTPWNDTDDLYALGGLPAPSQVKKEPPLPGLPQIEPQSDEPFQGTIPSGVPDELPPSRLPPTLQKTIVPQYGTPSDATTWAPSLSHGTTSQSGGSSWDPGMMGTLKKQFQKPQSFNTQKIGPALDPLKHKLQRSHKEFRLPTLKELFFKK